MTTAERVSMLAVVRHPVGGIRTYLTYVYGRLDPSRFDITVLAVAGAETQLLREKLPSWIHVVTAPRGASVPSLARAVYRASAERSYDVIHSHGLTAGVASVPAALRRSVPHLITSHDVFIPEQFSGVRGALKRAALTRVLNTASAIQSVSLGAEANLRRYLPGLDARKLRVIRNGVPLPDPADTDPSASGTERVRLGFFGRFMPQKGFDYVIEAVRILAEDPEVADRFIISAVNDGAFIREYRERIRALDLDRFFEFPGLAANPFEAYRRVDAVVMPSLWEACGLVAMEALVAGKPLIATEVDGLAEVLADSPARRVPPKDAPALAAEIRNLVMSLPSAQKAAFSYRLAAGRRFDVRATAQELDRLLREVARKGTSAFTPRQTAMTPLGPRSPLARRE